MHMAYNPTTKTVKLLAAAANASGGYLKSDEIKHDESTGEEAIQPDDLPKHGISHVLYHHVKDILYRVHKETGMRDITILPVA